MIFQANFFKTCGFQAGQNWDLLYRSSGSDYSGFELLSHCTGKSPTLVIIETHNKIIIGGYTALRWEKASQKVRDSEAFVFRKYPSKDTFEVFAKNEFEVICEPRCGPSFIGSNGFRIDGNSSICLYQNVVSDDKVDRFMIRAIEVFRRVKKRVDFFNKDAAPEKYSKAKYQLMRDNLKIWG